MSDVRQQEPDQRERNWEEVKRRTILYKANICTPAEKAKFKKIAANEAVFVLNEGRAADYKEHRERAALLMRREGPFSPAALAAHEAFELRHRVYITEELAEAGQEQQGNLVFNK